MVVARESVLDPWRRKNEPCGFMALPRHDPDLLELPPGVRRGVVADDERRRLSSGNAAIDRLLGGGFPRGALSEVTGGISTGRTSLACSLSAALCGGEMAAIVDPSDRFDPETAEAGGVDLARVLWVRPPGARPALRCTELLLATRGFGLVLLDLADLAPVVSGSFVWPRLARRAATSEAVLLLLSSRRLAGSAAHVCLSLQRGRARWPGHHLRPRLLDGITSSARVERIRAAVPGERTSLVAGA